MKDLVTTRSLRLPVLILCALPRRFFHAFPILLQFHRRVEARQLEEGGRNHIWALFYLGKLNLMLGKRREAETLFQEATVMGLKKWGAKNSHFEKLDREIRLAHAGEQR